MNFKSKIKGRIVEGIDDLMDLVSLLILIISALNPINQDLIQADDYMDQSNKEEVVGKILRAEDEKKVRRELQINILEHKTAEG